MIEKNAQCSKVPPLNCWPDRCRLTEGEVVVFENHSVHVWVAFMPLKKLMGTYQYCWTSKTQLVWRLKSVWRPSWTHKSLLVKWSDDLSYVEQSELYCRATWSLECMGSVWPVCWHALSGGLKAEMQHLRTDVKKTERFRGGGKMWSPLTVSEFIFQLLI